MITVSHVAKRFTDREVLRDVNLTIKPGQLVGIIGPSAGGKTTLLKCIAGLLPFDGGRVDVDGVALSPSASIYNPSAHSIRQRVGFVFQNLNLWPYKTALHNIIEGPLAVRRMDKKEAIRLAMNWAECLSIADYMDEYPPTLSGGQRQRIAIARALVMDPAFVLCDEITSSLDPILAGQIVDIMTTLKSRGIGIAFVTHQIDFIRRNADELYFLHHGEVVEAGSPQVILSTPKAPELESFIESVRHGW